MVEKPTLLAKLSIIDYGGMLLFFFGAGLIVLAVTWGGATYPWSSSAVLVPLIIGGLMLFSFVVYEHLMVPGRALSRIFPSQEPMIPLSLFHTKDMGILAYLNFSTGMAMFSVFLFCWYLVHHRPEVRFGQGWRPADFLHAWPRCWDIRRHVLVQHVAKVHVLAAVFRVNTGTAGRGHADMGSIPRRNTCG